MGTNGSMTIVWTRNLGSITVDHTEKKSFTDGSILSVVSMSDSSGTDLQYLSIAGYAQLRLHAQGIFFLLYHLEKILMTPTPYFNSNILT
jgi:hypothetical protein